MTFIILNHRLFYFCGMFCQGARGLPGAKGDVGSGGVKGDEVSLFFFYAKSL